MKIMNNVVLNVDIHFMLMFLRNKTELFNINNVIMCIVNVNVLSKLM